MVSANLPAPLDSRPSRVDVSLPAARKVTLLTPNTNVCQSAARMRFTQAEPAFVLKDSIELIKFVTNALKVTTMTLSF